MPPPLPPDSGDSPDPEGTITLTLEAAVFTCEGTPPETWDVKDGDWTRTKPSTGVGALLDWPTARLASVSNPMAREVRPLAPTTGVATTASDVRPLAPTTGVKRTEGVVRPAAGAMGVEKTASEVRPLAPTTGDGTTAMAVIPLATMSGVDIELAGISDAPLCPLAPTTGDRTTEGAELPLANVFSVGIDTAGWPAAAVSSDDELTARVTNGPALCSAGRDGMILTPISSGVGLAKGIASTLTPLPEKYGLGTTPATVVAGTTEASVTPASPVAEGEPTTDVVEDPTTAT